MDKLLGSLFTFALSLGGGSHSQQSFGQPLRVAQKQDSSKAPAAPAAPVSVPVSANDVVDKVQAFYASIGSVKAKFRQSVTNATFGGDPAVSDGMLYITKPGKMRWEYFGKAVKGKASVKKSFISNGSTLWMVEHDRKQVVKKDLATDLLPVTVTFLYGKGDLKKDFDAEIDNKSKYASAGELGLKLTPKQPSAQYKHLYLIVNPSNYRVTQSVLVDSADNINHFRFYTPDFEAKPAAALYEFDMKSVPKYKLVEAKDEPKTEPSDTQK